MNEHPFTPPPHGGGLSPEEHLRWQTWAEHADERNRKLVDELDDRLEALKECGEDPRRIRSLRKKIDAYKASRTREAEPRRALAEAIAKWLDPLDRDRFWLD